MNGHIFTPFAYYGFVKCFGAGDYILTSKCPRRINF